LSQHGARPIIVPLPKKGETKKRKTKNITQQILQNFWQLYKKIITTLLWII
jgi:hypothetical protein